ETRARNVIIRQITQRFVKFAAPIGVGARDFLGCWSGLPNAEEPNPIEAHFGEAIELGIGNIVECRNSAQLSRQLRQPNTGVDLIQRRIAGRRHIEWIGAVVSKVPHGTPQRRSLQAWSLHRSLQIEHGLLADAEQALLTSVEIGDKQQDNYKRQN